MTDCLFCELPKLRKNNIILFENDKVIVILDVDWVVKGHTLVIWKEHVTNIADLSGSDYLSFSKIVWKIEKILLNVLPVKRMINLKSGFSISHFHFHLYPVVTIDGDTINNLVRKKIKYIPTEDEKTDFVDKLQKGFNENTL